MKKLFCFMSICRFGSFKNLFATITSLSEFYFRSRRFILLVQTKKVIPMNYKSHRSRWKPLKWVGFDLILMMRNIYINSYLKPLTKFTNSSRSTEFKDILPWNISQMITKTSLKWSRPNQHENSQKVHGNWDNNMNRIFQWRESYCTTNTSVTKKN